MQRRGGTLVLLAPQDDVYRALEVGGLMDLLPLAECRDAALVLVRDGTTMTKLAAWLDLRLHALGSSRQEDFAVRLCLEEAVQNVVMHVTGNATIEIWLERRSGGLEAVVQDDGPAFDPLAHSPRKPPSSLQAAELGGLGLTLMRRFASALHFCRVGDTNCIAFDFSLNSGPA